MTLEKVKIIIIFQAYGTHYIVKNNMGAKYAELIELKRTAVENQKISGFDIGLGGSIFSWIKIGLKLGVGYDKDKYTK